MNESIQTDSCIHFDHKSIGLVIDGDEDAIIRADLEKNVEVDDTVELKTPKGHTFAYAEIEDVYESRVGQAYFDAVFTDNRSIAANSDEELLDHLKRHYSRDTTFDTPVTVIYFAVIDLQTPPSLNNNE